LFTPSTPQSSEKTPLASASHRLPQKADYPALWCIDTHQPVRHYAITQPLGKQTADQS